MEQEYDELTERPQAPSSNLNSFIWMAALLLLFATVAIVFSRRSGSPESESLEGVPGVQHNIEQTRGWNQKRYQEILNDAREDYQRFLRAEKDNDRTRRRRYFNLARVKLQGLMDEINDLDPADIKDEALVRRVAELLGDLSKKAHSGD